ncbi:hypothetical protein ACQJBY_002640 [Aegilops geniculata]
MSVTYTRWVHHGEAVNINVIDYVEAADHHLDLPDAQVEEEEEVVVAEPVKTSEQMTNKSFDAMLAAFRESFPDASELPHTYRKMRNFLRAVGIGYDMIHVWRTTHGYNACVRCDRNPLSYAILSKICYIGHRRFLAKDKPHPRKYRRHVFNAKHENRDAPKRLTADELQVELEKVQDEGKPRDMAPAVYVLDTVKRKEFCEVLSRVRFPHGFASNPERRVSADGNKVQGLKTHDCHVLLQRVLPVILRGLGRPDLYRAVAELGQFFRELCSRNIRIDALECLRDKIPTILCDLEKIYPPVFFDVMVHLAVHLPDEALLRGPVQYGWMYPIERRLGTFKGYVRNRARPEGSIAEAYIATEALTFCSKYIETADQLSKEVGEDNPGLNVFDYSVRVTGKSRQEDKPKDLDKMVCIYKEELLPQNPRNIDKLVMAGFAKWFNNHKMWEDGQAVDDALYSLAMGPDTRRNSFNEVAQQDDAYTAPDVQDNTNVPNIFENHHVNDAGEKIACRAVDIQELIKKKPTFEDVEDEEEDDTVGNYDSD